MDSSDDIGLVRKIGNKYNIEILSEIQDRKTVGKVTESLDIPIATCYRRFDELKEIGLVEEVGRTLSEKGGDVKLYRSKVSQIKINLNNDDIEIELEENKKEEKDHLAELWDDLK
ncbi:MAG: Transcriptional regulator containing HTH domain ArsR family [Candidatus Methanohalarchaeum thermophilum]|uniref:Transcriptional regulator containing HTH domain ArsR family n=1 Tax=Methanohalarchaeum thermophilum TaxID=1903181 RepID=A0A1Q6DWD0_METT1|nr:MAG: Transcriptional regulator containing HTH domain ArsR family [Candidatus Methanohalarchaeum thermophilum]